MDEFVVPARFKTTQERNDSGRSGNATAQAGKCNLRVWCLRYGADAKAQPRSLPYALSRWR